MFRRRTRDELESRRAETEAAIADHPMSSEQMREGRALIEEMGKDDTAALDEELAARDLPSVEEQGRMTAKHLVSFGRLHRKRKKLEDKLNSAKYQ